MPGDVSNLSDLDRFFAEIKQEKGRLDIVFANAGAARYSPLGKITEAFYDSTFLDRIFGGRNLLLLPTSYFVCIWPKMRRSYIGTQN